MNSLSRIVRVAALVGVTAAVGSIAALSSANATDLFALGASLFVLVIAARDYTATARRIQRAPRMASIACESRTRQDLQLAA